MPRKRVTTRKNPPRQRQLWRVGVFLAVGIIIFTSFIAIKLQQAQVVPDRFASKAEQDLVAQVSLILDLPAEQPTIATVTNPEKLTNQPFFARAELGDKILFYAQAREVVLYRPSTNKVMEVASLAHSQ